MGFVKKSSFDNLFYIYFPLINLIWFLTILSFSNKSDSWPSPNETTGQSGLCLLPVPFTTPTNRLWWDFFLCGYFPQEAELLMHNRIVMDPINCFNWNKYFTVIKPLAFYFILCSSMFSYKVTFNLFPISTPRNHSVIMVSIFSAHLISITIYAFLEILVCTLPSRITFC